MTPAPTILAALERVADQLRDYAQDNAASLKDDHELVLEAAQVMDRFFARAAELHSLKGYGHVVSGDVEGNLGFEIAEIEREARCPDPDRLREDREAAAADEWVQRRLEDRP